MFTPTALISSPDARARRFSAAVALAIALAVATAISISLSNCASAIPSADHQHSTESAVRLWTIHYTAHNGTESAAYVLLPAWYGPQNNPPLPLIISPHGRGANGRSNADFFGEMPAIGGFAVVSPDGMGRRTRRFSYGYPRQIDDLAKLPSIVTRALPWLRIDRTRIYALGSSMGGQETALLVARHPSLLAGAAAMDSVTDLSRRYHQLASLPCDSRCLKRWGMPRGRNLQSVMRREVGGTPETNPRAYAARSALSLARAIAKSGVPLQIWWSTADKIVSDQRHQSEALYREVRRLNPCAPVSAYSGRWKHSTEMRASSLLPIALAGFGLLPHPHRALPTSVRYQHTSTCETRSS
jgi:pimeloyl-ACP methyl ester carboxylesterase